MKMIWSFGMGAIFEMTIASQAIYVTRGDYVIEVPGLYTLENMTTLLDCFTHRCRILETGNDRLRIKESNDMLIT